MKNIISKRALSLKESGIRKVFDLAVRFPGEYTNLSIGQSDFVVSNLLKKRACKAVMENKNGYFPTMGVSMLRQKIARKLRKKNKIQTDPEDVIITSGVSGAILLAFSSLIDPGDEVILPDPYFILYEEVLQFLGAKIVYLDTYPDFHIQPEKIENLITSKTKAVVLNFPGNPTGAVLSKNEIENLAEVFIKKNILVISDEIYEDFCYDKKFFSIGSIYSKTLTLNGFSKSHAVAGWRIGYAHGPSEIISVMNKLQQYTFVCAPSFAQDAFCGESLLKSRVEVEGYRKKRDFVWENLKDTYRFKKPEGAFYAFLEKPNGRNNFFNEAIQKKLLIVPGGSFSQRDTHFRLSFSVPDDVLEKGIRILKDLV